MRRRRRPEWISVVGRRPVAGRVRRPAAWRSTTAGPIPRCALLRERVVADGAVGETLTIVSHVAAAVRTALRLRLVPEFAPLQEVKAGTPTAARWDATGAQACRRRSR